MSVAERDYSKGRSQGSCMFGHCSRPAKDPEKSIDMCAFHYSIWEADSNGCEATSAAKDIIPAMIKLAEASCNDYLAKELEKLRVEALDRAARCYLDYEMLRLEDDTERMDLE